MTGAGRTTLSIARILAASLAAAGAATAQSGDAAASAELSDVPEASETSEPSEEEIAEARELFEAAEATKEAGDYARAAEIYLEAYALFPNPEFLFNAGTVYALADEDERARHYFEAYLEEDPEGRGAEEAEQALTELGEPGPDRDEPDGATARRDGATSLSSDRSRGPEARDRQARDSGSGGALRIAAFSAAGAGVIALGASGYFGHRASSLSDEASEWETYDPDAFSRGETYDVAMLSLAGVGVAALAAGGALYYFDSRDRGGSATDPQWAATPLVSADFGGMAVTGRF